MADNTIVEMAVSITHQQTLQDECKIELNKNIFLIRTDTGEAYRFSSDLAAGYAPSGEATSLFHATSGTLLTPVVSASPASSVPYTGGGLLLQKAGNTTLYKPTKDVLLILRCCW